MRIGAALVLLGSLAAQDREPAFAARRAQLIRWWAGPAQPEPDWGGYPQIAAKLYWRENPEWCSRRLIELLKDPVGDMFWMFPVTAIAHLDRGQLTLEARQALRRAWKTYYPYRGDTENHWLLYYTSLYLTAQLDPQSGGGTWYTGKSAQENRREASEYIRSWMDLTLEKGQGEYDCTHYLGVYLLPLSYLAAWADDPDLKLRAQMMLEYVIADYAFENLNGLYAGSHARTDDVAVVEKWKTVSSDFGWLLFGQGPEMPVHSMYAGLYAMSSGYQPPAILHQIATDRSQDYVHREKKRTRNRWRYSELRHAPVYKTTYVRKNYAVGSDQGGVLQPIQQHSWDVTWAVDDPRGKHNTLFTTHPYSSSYELQMYFSPMPDYFLDEVLRSKKTYDSPDKLIGGSPYEQIFQDQDTVIALYQIKPGTRFPHIHAFFSRDLVGRRQDESGWIVARGGDAYLAYYPLAPYEWQPHQIDGKPTGSLRLVSPYLKNGAIVQVADVSEFASLEAFQKAVSELPLRVTLDPVPGVEFTSLRGRVLRFTYGSAPTVNGVAVDYANWPMFESRFVEARPGTRRMELRYGAKRRVLDFRKPEIREFEVR
jgi:hypothetical protein